MVLRQLQHLLAGFYDAPSTYDIYDFLTTDRSILPLSPDSSDEQVLLVEDECGPHLGVYIDGDVLARLARSNPWDELSATNLADYCTALEGVSHFHYLTWRITHGRPVSLLELELQAEVDKYVGALWLIHQQSGHYPRGLHSRLFDRIGFVRGLDGESLKRYQLANKHAAHYCRKLDERYLSIRRARPEAWRAELRRFYRYGHAEKMRRAGA